ncbi:GFA family protein [Pulveribacter sp.]|uniref:GFA family protein n=1 Tax=Pulveribacter sp. TaxID=2678893 RepID=UPI0028B03704|nr:GFA family protein [Pulveribacter sp.]
MQITGKCHCGAISYTAQVDPARVQVCHCADCQQFSGAPFRAVLPTPVEDVALTGQPRHYVKVAESGNRRAQGFCAECGTQLYATEADQPKVLNLRLGCVNERAQLVPQRQIWGESAMPWLPTLAALPLHVKGAASELLPPG